MAERSKYHIVVWTRKGPLLSKALEFESVTSKIVLLLKSSYVLVVKTMKT